MEDATKDDTLWVHTFLKILSLHINVFTAII